jgi:hypothetical protein
MKRILAATCCLTAWGFLAAAGAQTPQPDRPQAEKQVQTPTEPSVTLKGCLAAGEEPNTFKLANIQPPEGEPAPGEMVGTTGIKQGGAVRLIGTDDLKLEPHKGHTVEVTGTLVPPSDTAQEPPAEPDPTRAGQDREEEMRLNVKSFKHVDATCPPATR